VILQITVPTFSLDEPQHLARSLALIISNQLKMPSAISALGIHADALSDIRFLAIAVSFAWTLITITPPAVFGFVGFLDSPHKKRIHTILTHEANVLDHRANRLPPVTERAWTEIFVSIRIIERVGARIGTRYWQGSTAVQQLISVLTLHGTGLTSQRFSDFWNVGACNASSACLPAQAADLSVTTSVELRSQVTSLSATLASPDCINDSTPDLFDQSHLFDDSVSEQAVRSVSIAVHAASVVSELCSYGYLEGW